MKKLILVLVVSLVLVFAVSYVSLADKTVKAGYDLGGTLTDGASSMSVDGGLSLGFEYTFGMSDNLMVGVGLEYQFTRKPTGISSGFNINPFYGLVQYTFDQFYVIDRLGYGLYSQEATFSYGYDADGGLYYGVGAGYSINENMVVEAVYGVSTVSFTTPGITTTGTYSKLGLLLGYKF